MNGREWMGYLRDPVTVYFQVLSFLGERAAADGRMD
jgi:hypothetical protein